MRQMKTKAHVQVIEIDGEYKDRISERPEIVVTNHWNRDSLVVLIIDGKEYAVSFLELLKAMQNAVNTSV